MKLPKTRSELIPLLQSRRLAPRKGLSQSLLLDPNMLAAIAADAGLTRADVVLEIGCGPGTLTEYLLEHAGHVVAVELDAGMAALVRGALGGEDASGPDGIVPPPVQSLTQALTLIEADALAHGRVINPVIVETLLDVRRRAGLAGLKVAANLPYSVASTIVVALLESALPIERISVLVQLEVARKMAAAPGEDDYGLLSLLCLMKAEAVVGRHVPPHCFWPRPKVNSALVHLTPRPDRVADAEYRTVKAVAGAIFNYRRKTLLAAMRAAFGLDGDEARAWLERAALAPAARIETLSLAKVRELTAQRPAGIAPGCNPATLLH